MLDLHNEIVAKRLISPVTQTNADTAIVSQIIDLSGCKGAEIVLAFGTLSDGDATFTVLLEDGENSALSDNATVDTAAKGLLGTIPAPDKDSDDKVFRFGYAGAKRYLRLTVTPSGNNAGNCPIAAVAILQPSKLPQAQP